MARTVIEEGENFKIYSDGTVLVRNVRFSYCHLDEKWAKNEGEKKKFSIVGMLPKKTHAVAIRRVRKVADDLIDAQKGFSSKVFKKSDKFIRDGNDSGKEQYFDHWTINASEERRPSVRGPDTKPIPVEEIKERVKSGYWGDILIRPWWQDNVHGKKPNAGLSAVQLKKKDTPFEQGGVSEEDIDETFDEAEDYDDDFDGGGFDADDDDDL